QLVPSATLLRQQNRGLSAARNAGVRVAQGEFLQLLDCDDTLEPGKIEAQVAAARHEAWDVVYSRFRVVVVQGSEVTHQPFQGGQPATEMIEALLTDWWAPPIAYLFRRQAYVDVGGCDESLKVWEDFDLFLRLALAGKKHGYAPG